MKGLFSIMSNLQTHYHFKLDFQNVDQHTEGTWLIHGTKLRKDNQLQSLELPSKIVEDLNIIKRSPKLTCSIQYSKGVSRGRIHPVNQNYLVRKG